ncbi:MAG: hypothetical protein WDM86_18580 [Rhizomicrobium sp.]
MQSYATGAATGGDDSAWVGGLVGDNAGAILQSYATGAAHAGLNGGGGFVASVGGLVGENEDGGAIAESYSTGAVSSSDPAAAVGGFLGNNDDTISSDVDVNYFDTQTSGTASGRGAGNPVDGVTGETTAQLQGTLPAGFDSTVWGTGAGLYPYFLWRYPATPEAITGVAYSDASVTPLASGSAGAVNVSALVDGTGVGGATTGANGYYYILVSHGTLAGTQQVLTYLDGASVAANTYVDSPAGNVTADLYGNYLRLLSRAGTSSAMFGGVTAAIGGNSGSDFLFGGGGLMPGTNLAIQSSNGGGLVLDDLPDLSSASLVLDAFRSGHAKRGDRRREPGSAGCGRQL